MSFKHLPAWVMALGALGDRNEGPSRLDTIRMLIDAKWLQVVDFFKPTPRR